MPDLGRERAGGFHRARRPHRPSLQGVVQLDGKRVVTASSDKTVVIYPVPFNSELESLARQSLTRCLTTAQRETFGLFVDGNHDEDRYSVHAPLC